MPHKATDETTPIISPGKLFLDPAHFEAHLRDLPGPRPFLSEFRLTLDERSREIPDSSFGDTPDG